MVVVDTNVVAYLMLPGDWTAAAEALLESQPNWLAPPLWKSEFRNSWRATCAQAEAEDVLAGNEIQAESQASLRWVAQSPCSAYDCEFVALAQQVECALYTVDAKVLSAFPQTARSLRKA